MALNTLQFRMLGLKKAAEEFTGKEVERIGSDIDGYIKIFFKDGSALEHKEIIKLVGNKW